MMDRTIKFRGKRIDNGEYDFKISINEGREYKEYTDSIHNFIIF